MLASNSFLSFFFYSFILFFFYSFFLSKQKLVSRTGLEEFNGKVDNYSMALLKMISELKFLPEYHGATSIKENSSLIHDFFRLVVNPDIFGEVGAELPLDWNQGLDNYLTVFLNFPGFDTNNLINFSIIDTPGIDEYGVKKLNLNRMIQDALGVATYGALIARNQDVNATGIQNLLSYFGNIYENYQTPLAAVITHCDSKTPTDEDIVTISERLTLVPQKPIFSRERIHPVSAKKMFLCRAMKKILANGKPNLSDVDSTTAEIINEFLAVSGRKDAWFEEATDEDLDKVLQRLEKSSNMKKMIDHFLQIASSEGIPILIQKVVKRVEERMISFTNRFTQAPDMKKFTDIMKATKRDIRKLKSLQQQLRQNLEEQQKKFLKDIEEKVSGWETELRTLFNSPINLGSPANLSSLTDYLQVQLRKFSPETKRLFTEIKNVSFEETAYTEICKDVLLKFRFAIRQFLWLQFKSKPGELMQETFEARKNIEEEFNKIAQKLNSNFKIQTQPGLLKDLAIEEDSTSPEELSLSPWAVKKRTQKTKFQWSSLLKGTLGTQSTQRVTVSPSDFRKEALETLLPILHEIASNIEQELAAKIDNILAVMEGNVNGEVNRLVELANSLIQYYAKSHEELHRPITETITFAENVITELHDLVRECSFD